MRFYLRIRRAVSSATSLIFLVIILVSIITPLIDFYLSGSSRVFYSANSYNKFVDERDSENIVFEFRLLDYPEYKIINRGITPIKIIRAFIQKEDGSLAIVSLNIDLNPSQSIDLSSIISHISNIINEDISPDKILVLVTSRGNTVSIRNNIVSLNIVNIRYSIETPNFVPDRSLLYWNFSDLLKQNRISASYSTSGAYCSISGEAYLDYMIPGGTRLYPTPLLFVKRKSGDVVIFTFSNSSGCQQYTFRNIISIEPSVSSVRVYFRVIAYITSGYRYSSLEYDYWNLNLSISIRSDNNVIGSGYTIISVPIYKDPVSLLLVSATTGYIDIPVTSYDPSSRYNLTITLQLTQIAGRILSSVMGLDYIVVQNAKLS